MFSIENNNITITKGDSGKINLRFTNGDGTEYIPSDTDKFIFSVKRKKESFSPLILEKYGVEIIFDAKETENIFAGEYVYDVVIVRSTGERQTVIEGDFTVRKAVHEFE